MPIPSDISGRELNKFFDSAGTPVVRICNADGSAVSAGGGGGVAMADLAVFTAGTSSDTPVGGVFNDGLAAVVSGNQAAVRITPNRGFHANLRDNSGNEIASATAAPAGGTRGLVVWVGNPGGLATDNTAFTAGSTGESTLGGVYNDAIATPTSGNQAAARITQNRALHVNLRNAAGTELGTTATPMNNNLAQVGGTNVVTAAAGVQKVGFVGNAGASVDAVVGVGAAPANMVAVGGVYNSVALAPANTQSLALQLDQAGNLRGFPGIALGAFAAWTSATLVNVTDTIYTNSGAPAVLVQLDQTTTITAGAVTFEGTYDGTNWVALAADQLLDPTSATLAQVANPYILQASTNKPFLILTHGMQGVRIRLSTVITGTGTVTPNYALLPTAQVQEVIAFSPTAANFNATVTEGTNPWHVDGAGAQGVAVTGNVLRDGHRAATANPTAVADGQAVDSMGDKLGRTVVALGQIRDNVVMINAVTISTTTETTILAAAGAGIFQDLTALVLDNTSATAVRVDIRDATAGTVIYPIYIPAGDTRGITLTGPMKQTTANNNWTAQLSGAVTDVRIWGRAEKNT